MGAREFLNGSRRTTLIVSFLVTGASIALIIIQISRGDIASTVSTGTAFFTVDDGVTFFEGSAASIPPFDQGGKTAVRANLFVCNTSGLRFVGYVSRFQPLARRALSVAAGLHLPSGQRPDDSQAKILKIARAEQEAGLEVKRPGQTKWINAAKQPKDAEEIMNHVTCPEDGTPAERLRP